MDTQSGKQEGAAERRSLGYTFASRRALVGFFSDALAPHVIEEAVRSIETSFVPRKESSRKERKFQLLKKCELALIRKVRETEEGAGNG